MHVPTLIQQKVKNTVGVVTLTLTGMYMPLCKTQWDVRNISLNIYAYCVYPQDAINDIDMVSFSTE